MFDKLPLHDATLLFANLDWRKGNLTLLIEMTPAKSGRLIFSGLAGLTIPREFPWGSSVSINCARNTETDAFEIEMQSGDVLLIQAQGWQFLAGIEP
jgi:hypothetical protein